MRTNLQIPLDKNLRDTSAQIALEYGFSSLQDAVRIFLVQLSQRKIQINLSTRTPDEILTPAQEKVLTKKYKLALKDIKKNSSARDADDLISQLHSA